MSVSLVKLRIATFIPDAWISSARASANQRIEFRGDDREFTPYACHTGHSRVAQEVVVDFGRETVTAHPETGPSMERVTAPDGSVTVRTATAPTDGITCTDITWDDDGGRFTTAASVSNPLDEAAPPVDFVFEVRVSSDGTVDFAGRHDGFPCFEAYKQIGFDSFEPIYTYDYRNTDASPKTLADPMDQTVNRTV